jgi:hypothetical protein
MNSKINVNELITALQNVDGTLKVADNKGNIAELSNFYVAFDEDTGTDNLIFNVSNFDNDTNDKSTFVIQTNKTNNVTNDSIDVFGDLDNTGL